jgi:hypothetical protein
MTFEHFQTFHIWLLSFGSFAAKHWSFDTASYAAGTDLYDPSILRDLRVKKLIVPT